MPTVIPFEDETIDAFLKRFKFRISKSGILGEASRKRFYLTKSQRRRLKSAKARKRERKRVHLAKRFEEPDFKPWTTDTQWPPDMGQKPDSDGTSYFYKKNADLVQEEPTYFVFGIAVFKTPDGNKVTILVKDDPGNNDGKGQSGRWGFPGGGAKPNEPTEECVVREYLEETGLQIRKPTKKNIVLEVNVGTHTAIGYRVSIIGGKLVTGEEIEDVAVVKLPELRQWIERGLLLPKHRRAAEAILERVKI